MQPGRARVGDCRRDVARPAAVLPARPHQRHALARRQGAARCARRVIAGFRGTSPHLCLFTISLALARRRGMGPRFCVLTCSPALCNVKTHPFLPTGPGWDCGVQPGATPSAASRVASCVLIPSQHGGAQGMVTLSILSCPGTHAISVSLPLPGRCPLADGVLGCPLRASCVHGS